MCSFQTGTVDYLPTILDLVGLPGIRKRPMDGLSLKPVLEGKLSERSVPLALGYQRLYKDTELFGLIDGPFKIVIPEEGEAMMLFDLVNDPTESNDLSESKPQLFKEMKANLVKV